MPALSKKQQKFMGIVRSIQKGEQPASEFSKDAQDAAKDMKKSSVKKFASTKHKGLPMKKEILGKLKELIKQELSEYTYGVGDVVKDDNPTCPHYGAQGKVKSVNPKSVVFVVTNKGDNFEPGQELEKSHDQMKKIGESINEMSAKTKKIINKLGKKEKEMFMDMVDMMGFDQVMMDYKRDKKAFKQALKDMSEGFASAAQRRAAFASGYKEKGKKKKKNENINEYVEPNQFNKNFEKAIDLVIRQANNLKGPLAKHPIKRNVNKLKAVQKLYKKFIAPILVTKDRNLSKDFNFTDIKKKLADGKFKYALEYSIMNRVGGGGYDSNSFFMLDDKQKKLLDRIYGELRKIVNVMDKAQLENINEDGHTDVASSKRKVMIMVQDSNILLNKLNGMNKEDSLPSWWTDKITLSQNYLAKATDYIINPVESVNESKELDTIEKIVKSTKNFMGVGKALKKVGIKSDFQTSMGLPRYTFKLNGKTYGILNKKSVSKPDRVVGDIAFGVMESMNPSAVKKMRDEFEKTGQLPPHLKKFALDLKILKKKHKVKNIVVPGLEWMSDMKEQSVNEKKKMFLHLLRRDFYLFGF